MVDRLDPHEQLTKGLEKAGILENQNKHQEAIEAYTALEREYGEDPRIYNGRGICFRMLKDPAAAIADFTHAQELAIIFHNKEEELNAKVGLIDAWRTADRNPNFNPWQDIQPQDSRVEFFKRAQNFMVEAKVLMGTMPESSLATIHAYTNFGLLHHDMGDLQTASVDYTKATHLARHLVAKDPNNPVYVDRLARALTTQGVNQLELGDISGARASQDEALAIYIASGNERGFGNAGIGMGDVLLGQNQFKSSGDYYLKVLNRAAPREDYAGDEDICKVATQRLENLFDKIWDRLSKESQEVAALIISKKAGVDKDALLYAFEEDVIDTDKVLQELEELGLITQVTMLQYHNEELATLQKPPDEWDPFDASISQETMNQWFRYKSLKETIEKYEKALRENKPLETVKEANLIYVKFRFSPYLETDK